MKHASKRLLSILLSLVLVLGLMPGMSLTAYAAPAETLLTTLTFGGSSTYSETTSGVVSVTATDVDLYHATYGWCWMRKEVPVPCLLQRKKDTLSPNVYSAKVNGILSRIPRHHLRYILMGRTVS